MILPMHEAETCNCGPCRDAREEQTRKEDRAVFFGLLGIAFLFAGLLWAVIKAS